jgi:hypothetical protein
VLVGIDAERQTDTGCTTVAAGWHSLQINLRFSRLESPIGGTTGRQIRDLDNFIREASVHFGLYLKNKGIISADQLVAALEAQLHALVPIGQLALEEGILSARDIFDVLRAQSESPQVRFGELAIELGMMDRDQLMRLLMIQSDRKRSVADILIWQGAITERQAALEMAAYRRAHSERQRPTMKTRLVPVKRPHQRPVHGPEPALSI